MANKKTDAPAQTTMPETAMDWENLAADVAVKYGKVALVALAVVFVAGIFMAMSSDDPNEAIAHAELDKQIGILKNDAMSYNPVKDEDLEKDITKFSTVMNDHKGTKASADATYYRAMAYFHSAKFEEAANDFKTFFSENTNQFPLTPLAHLGAAKSLMSQGKKEKVQEAIEILKLGRNSVGNADFKNRFTYQLGVCYAILGKKDEAKNELTPLAEAKKSETGKRPFRSQEAAALLRLVKNNDAAVLAEFLTDLPKSLVKEEPKDEKVDAPSVINK